MIPNYKRPTFKEYLLEVLDRPLDDQDLDMIEYCEQLEEENKKLTEARNWYFEHAVTPEMLHKILRQDYISKSVIRKKIKELEKAKGKYGDTPRLYTAYDTYDFQTNILKELLGEE